MPGKEVNYSSLHDFLIANPFVAQHHKRDFFIVNVLKDLSPYLALLRF